MVIIFFNCICFQDGSGTIDKEELRDLFMDIFPGFHRCVCVYKTLLKTVVKSQ